MRLLMLGSLQKKLCLLLLTIFIIGCGGIFYYYAVLRQPLNFLFSFNLLQTNAYISAIDTDPNFSFKINPIASNNLSNKIQTFITNNISPDIKNVSVVLTDQPQKNKVNWNDNDHIVHYMSSDSKIQGDTLYCYLYFNNESIKTYNVSNEQISKDSSSLFIQALLNSIPDSNFQNIVDDSVTLYKQWSKEITLPFFLVTYE